MNSTNLDENIVQKINPIPSTQNLSPFSKKQEFTMTSEEYEQERINVHKVIFAFKSYSDHMFSRVKRFEMNILNLKPQYRIMVPNFPDRLSWFSDAIKSNAEFINSILFACDEVFINSDVANTPKYRITLSSHHEYNLSHSITNLEIDKVITTLKQFYRDWSNEGKYERDLCYKPIMDQVRIFYGDSLLRASIRILVPGCGLARLAFELAKEGYTCQGNEFSMYMLLASNFILNNDVEIGQYKIFPWIHSFLNCWSVENQITPISIPDIYPGALPKLGNFSITAGDFLIVYQDDSNQWDCVTTCYFIDTARNIFEYIECIWKILKPGGLWINFGPLLYHFAEMPSEISIELTYADLITIITKEFNFQIIVEEKDQKSTYIENTHSMLTYQYNCAFFVAKKTLHF